MKIKEYTFNTKQGLYGAAVNYTIVDSEGKMWIGNNEYESQVNYCPMTGIAAPTQINVVKVYSDGREEYNNTLPYKGEGHK